jgi:lipoprotein Spr
MKIHQLFFASCFSLLFFNVNVHAALNIKKDLKTPTAVDRTLLITGNEMIDQAQLTPEQLLTFAQTLIGTPYRSASSSPVQGFDCSGFVNYVFKNFDIKVPRSSGDFASVGVSVKLEDAMPGDLILFTGTHTKSRRIGHVGIVFCNADSTLKFIHSTSGKAHGVTITNMDNYYHHRFVKVIRIFKISNLSS